MTTWTEIDTTTPAPSTNWAVIPTITSVNPYVTNAIAELPFASSGSAIVNEFRWNTINTSHSTVWNEIDDSQ